MSYLVFARKFRPQTFDQVIQQDHVTHTLANAITAGRVSHAILFTGPRGTGKTTVARILAKAMNCAQGPTATPCNACRSCEEITKGHAADVFEIDGASNNSVDQVRELRENLKYMPTSGRYKIYIIDEVHMLSTAAFNALLKTLEEPPAHVMFIFATTEAHKIPVTILSRCQRHDLRRIDTAAVIAQMRHICEQEGVAIDEGGLSVIAAEAGGSMRDALSLLDHVLACTRDGGVTAELVADLLGAAERKHLFALSAAVFERDLRKVLEIIDHVWRHGLEIKRFYTDLLAHFHHLAVVKMGNQIRSLVDLPENEILQMQTQVRDVPGTYLTQLLDLLFQAEPSIKLSSQPRLALEMVFFKLFQTPPALPIETLIDRLDQLRDSDQVAASPPPATATVKQSIADVPDIPDAKVQAAPAATPPPPESQSPLTQPQEGRPHLAGNQNAGPRLWEEVVRFVSEEKPSLAAFLNKCNATPEADDQFVLEVNGNEFMLKSIEKSRPYLEEVCRECAGKTISLALKTNSTNAVDRQKEKKAADKLKQQALGNPLVLASLELFDGKIVDVKIP